MNKPLKRGSVAGILGGGQLGRMLAMAGADLGYKTCVYCPDEGSCAFDVASSYIQKKYDDIDGLQDFASRCDVITTEFENVPIETIDLLEKNWAMKPFYPGRKALATSQDRVLEKYMAVKLGIEIPDFTTINTGLERFNIPFPVMLKKRREGYDGKGQHKVHSYEELLEWFNIFKRVPCIAERVVDFKCEISVTVAMGITGSYVVYEPFENIHENGILVQTQWPMTANLLTPDQYDTAKSNAVAIAKELGVIGVITVEMFATDHDVLFNEIAPRAHNTGHITRDCAITSQFHNQIRAITGHQLGDPKPFARGKMINLLGCRYSPEPVMAGNTRAYFYNKEDKDGRKVGHMVYLSSL